MFQPPSVEQSNSWAYGAKAMQDIFGKILANDNQKILNKYLPEKSEQEILKDKLANALHSGTLNADIENGNLRPRMTLASILGKEQENEWNPKIWNSEIGLRDSQIPLNQANTRHINTETDFYPQEAMSRMGLQNAQARGLNTTSNRGSMENSVLNDILSQQSDQSGKQDQISGNANQLPQQQDIKDILGKVVAQNSQNNKGNAFSGANQNVEQNQPEQLGGGYNVQETEQPQNNYEDKLEKLNKFNSALKGSMDKNSGKSSNEQQDIKSSNEQQDIKEYNNYWKPELQSNLSDAKSSEDLKYNLSKMKEHLEKFYEKGGTAPSLQEMTKWQKDGSFFDKMKNYDDELGQVAMYQAAISNNAFKGTKNVRNLREYENIVNSLPRAFMSKNAMESVINEAYQKNDKIMDYLDYMNDTYKKGKQSPDESILPNEAFSKYVKERENKENKQDSSNAPEGMVRVKAKNGHIGFISKDKLDEAITKRGAIAL